MQAARTSPTSCSGKKFNFKIIKSKSIYNEFLQEHPVDALLRLRTGLGMSLGHEDEHQRVGEQAALDVLVFLQKKRNFL